MRLAAFAILLLACTPGLLAAELKYRFAVDDDRTFEGDALRAGEHAGTALVVEERGPGIALATGAASGLYTSPWTDVPFPANEVLVSWNVARAESGGFAVALRCRRETGEVSAWYGIGSSGGHPGVPRATTKDEGGTVEVDWFRGHGFYRAYQWRIGLRRDAAAGPSPRLDRIAVIASNAPGSPELAAQHRRALSPEPPAGPLHIEVPFRSQKAEAAAIAGRICSPTSVAMVLEHRGVKLPTAEVAARAFDAAHDIYGNWPANIQAAYACGVPGRLARFRSWAQARAAIAAGQPLIISIRDRDGVLKGAPYERTSGHLLVLTGFDAAGNPRVNDPAAPDAARGVTAYDRDAMERVWLDQGGIAYLLQSPTPAPAVPAPPNIIFILADDLGVGDLGCYGQQRIRTPSLDRLAAQGMRFTQFYAGSPVCAPSRCVLLTGLHTGHAAIRDNAEAQGEGQLPLPAGTATIASLLRERGYATAAIGKWGLGAAGTSGEPGRQGFDRFFGYLCQRQAHNHYPDHLWRDGEKVVLEGNTEGNLVGQRYAHDLMTDEALAWVRATHRDRPFFLYLPYHLPHLALQVPDDSLAAYRGKWDDPPYDGKDGYLAHPSPRAAYAAMVSRMDRDVGRLLDLLESLGIAGRTAVFFSSDNGPTFGRQGGADSEFFQSAGRLRGLKGSVQEGGIRVPFIAAWPGRIPAGSTSRHVGAFEDVLPTLLELAGGKAPAGLDGISFAPTLLASGEQPQHEHLYWEIPSYGGQQAVRLGKWKGIREGIGKGQRRLKLYDLEKDPRESQDLSALQSSVVRRMEEILLTARRPCPEFPFSGLDP